MINSFYRVNKKQTKHNVLFNILASRKYKCDAVLSNRTSGKYITKSEKH